MEEVSSLLHGHVSSINADVSPFSETLAGGGEALLARARVPIVYCVLIDDEPGRGGETAGEGAFAAARQADE